MTLQDLFRALRNKNFALACVFGLIALAHGLADYEPGISLRVAHLPPFYINAYDAFIWAHNGIISIIAPLIATLSFADSLALDRSSGYLRFILLRTSRRNYLLSKMFACAVAGGLAITLPFVVMYGYTSLSLSPEVFLRRNNHASCPTPGHWDHSGRSTGRRLMRISGACWDSYSSSV